MDNVLKSVPSVSDTIILIQEVADLCKNCRLALTKITKDALFQIHGVKNKALTDNLPIGRVLWIFWDTENYVIKFNKDLKNQPMRRQGMSLVQYMILLS